ncbi:TetR/AcrR family transcriptional regulator [Actinocorallia populi]|uniref:TetR/AcrR family transcriptional regulator n=1 Tax=Actinocorallia populi TaxID=2079200 RepID=UPI0018E58CCE|nr:TetR/AcrR family transcriptional regulator [Actinocorallia populi]
MPRLVDHAARRRQIAEALLAVASERGLHAATMREVAAEAGVSLRLVQYYFHSKDELLAGALEHLAARLGERVRARTAGARDVRSLLLGTLSAVLPDDEDGRRVILTYHAYYAHALSRGGPSEQGARDAAVLEGLLASQVARAQEEGLVAASLDRGAVAAELLAVANGLGISVLTGRRDGAAALAVLTGCVDRLLGS